MTFFKQNRFFIMVSALIAIIDIAFVCMTCMQAEKNLEIEEAQQITNYFSAFDIAFEATKENMLQISNIVANEPRYASLFLEGKHAVQNEGGGAGLEQAQRVRSKLNDAIAENWQQFSHKFHARQLHFHLGPGSTSFLRVHKPHKFGDNMDQVRFTIVDTNQMQHEVTGFETGRVYSGIRGVSPVFAINDQGEREHAGAVEAGTSFSDVFNTVRRSLTQVHGAVFLNIEHLQRNVWPEYLTKRLEQTPPVGNLVIEYSSDDIGSTLLAESMMMQGRELTDSQITLNVLSYAGKTILFGSRPLRDYHGQQHPDSPDAGQILLWKDVTALHDTYRHNFWVSIVSAVIAFVFVEILIFFALKLASKRLEAIIEQRTDDVASRAKALDATPNFIAITDIEGNIEYVNAKATEITGSDEHELLGQNMAILSSGRTDNLTYQRLWKTILAGDEWRGEILNKRKDGQLYWAQNIISVQTNRDGHTTKFIVSQHDITEERKEREVILSHANTDPLTHLVNRRGFENHIHRLFESSKARNQSFVLLFLDLDHFKQINDQCGHQAGDKVLVDISQLIRQNLREHDVIARLGGDEFAVILEDCPLDNAHQIAEKICSAVNGYEFNCSNRTYKLGVSVGLTTSKEHDAHWNQTLHRADSACYAAKTAGRGQVRSLT